MMTPHLLPDVGGDPRRLVQLDAVHNFRDMGGYPTYDGHTTRWGRLFRADGLYRLTGIDLDRVRELGLHTVIDLRTAAEVDERGTFPHLEHPVHFHHVPIIDETWNPEDVVDTDDAAEFLETAYVAMLEEGPDRFAQAIRTLCVPGAFPAVFHCAAGKDRTGMLAMLLLGAVGVEDDYIIADYALTEAGMQRFRDWAMREFPEMAARWAETPAVFSAAVPEAMMRMIGHVRRDYSSIANFVRELGVSDQEITQLRAELLS
ncbi:MAG: tyrosine-protein phosphatase [Actinomycetota bacterium]